MLSGSEIQVNQPGTYQLVLERAGCQLPSNEIVINPFDESLITLDISGTVVFPEGGSKTVTAAGAENYRWYDANNQEIGNGPSMNFTQEGSFILIASVGNCQVSRNVQVEYLETFRVPNVISVNGDGINDLWVLPNSYSNKKDVRITIYNERGEEIFNQSNYQNNWPESSRAFPRQNMVFFYKIRNAETVLKQGTITVIR
jgi:gliding motility-associated-like protein